MGSEAEVSFEGRVYRFATHGPADRISRRLLEKRQFHEMRTLCLLRRIGPRGAYVDVGAHLGNHGVFFACECPSTEVICCEADAGNRALLEQNLKANCHKPWRVIGEMVGRGGEGYDLRDVDPGNTGARAPVPGTAFIARSLDELLAGRTNIALLKVDVEGAELAVLEGARKLLQANYPLLVTECGDRRQERALRELLDPLGYRLRARRNQPPNLFWRARKGWLSWHH